MYQKFNFPTLGQSLVVKSWDFGSRFALFIQVQNLIRAINSCESVPTSLYPNFNLNGSTYA